VNVISLTTDFGTQDWFVGTMKGVILRVCPRARIVDITHETPAGDIRAGAFALAASCRFFPKGTVHLAVVDPGVGGARGAIAVRTADYFFAGPDNGVLSLALARERIKAIHRLENEDCFLSRVSRTFHGRDIFAPVAARLCGGLPIRKVGPRQKGFVGLRWPEPQMRRGEIEGEVVYIDRFGNLITNIRGEALRGLDSGRCRLIVRGTRVIPMGTHYEAVGNGRAVAVVGSSDVVEIAVNGGSAAREFGLGIGSRVRIRLAG
jgi:S-adenosyl-L-methionine hydrolase (adenosine-forming)